MQEEFFGEFALQAGEGGICQEGGILPEDAPLTMTSIMSVLRLGLAQQTWQSTAGLVCDCRASRRAASSHNNARRVL
jgi:hypothetical protein